MGKMILVRRGAESEQRGELLFGTPNLLETLAESVAELLFNFGGDQFHRIHILDMDLVLEAEAG